MDIHKPKPIHSWRELLTEIGVIVIGVAIALAGEQAVEKLRDHSRTAEARASIREEIARNLGRMNVRQAVEPCMGKRLDEVDGLIAASAAGKLPQEVLWIGLPTVENMFDSTYKATMQSGITSLFGYREQKVYANLYSAFEIYWQQSLNETLVWGDLRTLEKHPSPSATLDWQLRSAMQRVRIDRYAIDSMRYYAMRDAAAIGVTPTQEAKVKLPSTCIPLHTPREQALKMSAVPGLDVPIP
jgi:hypothetical protein